MSNRKVVQAAGNCEVHVCENRAESVLREAKRSGKPVRLIFANGYQTKAIIEDFDYATIVARVRGALWLVNQHNLSTIVLEE